jgi:nucleoid DNA-binding protein
MYQLKTKENDSDVIEFIEQAGNPKKREDAYKLLEIFTEMTGFQARMWGTSIIGFGAYHYKYKSGHEGDAPLVGFSPRKTKISLYFPPGDTHLDDLLKDFGKYTRGKACVYINKIADIEIDVLKALIKQSVVTLKENYPNQ